jgi:hypothetical protein
MSIDCLPKAFQSYQNQRSSGIVMDDDNCVCVFFSIFLLQTVPAALAKLLKMRSLPSLYIINIAFSFASIPQLKTQKSSCKISNSLI